MASFPNNTPSTSGVTNNLLGRERSIASSFVKQYYTLLNKAPQIIYFFYSTHSTLIHGSVDMANENYTEPIVGRENIKKKMEDLNLVDCRAKIERIDCLETLAGGLVIQVIGELSNNGKPMRRFLQTFVLAPSPDESSAPNRQDGDNRQPSDRTLNATASSTNTDRRNTNQLYEGVANQASPQNQKFYVLNHIFRFQDDGADSEFEDDNSAVQANVSSDNSNGGSNEVAGTNKSTGYVAPKQAATNATSITIGNNKPQNIPNGPSSDHPQNKRIPHRLTAAEQAPVASRNQADDVDKLANDLNGSVKLTKPVNESEFKRDTKVVSSNGLSCNIDKKSESTEKTAENCNKALATANDNQSSVPIPATAGSAQSQPGSSTANVATATAPAGAPTARSQASSALKTWANMVKSASVSTQAPASRVASEQQPQQQQTSSSMVNANVATLPTASTVVSQPQPQTQQQPQQQQQPQMQSHQSTNQNTPPAQQSQQMLPLPPQQQPQSHKNINSAPNTNITINLSNVVSNNGNTNNSNSNINMNRRRHTVRKQNNKPNGRPIYKSRPNRPPPSSGRPVD